MRLKKSFLNNRNKTCYASVRQCGHIVTGRSGRPGVKLCGGGSDRPTCQNASFVSESFRLRFNVGDGGKGLVRGFKVDVDAG